MIIPASTLALIKFGAEAIQTIAPMLAANNVERDSHGRPKGFNEFGNFMKTLSQGAGALSMGIGAYSKFMDLKAPATSGTDGDVSKVTGGGVKEALGIGSITEDVIRQDAFDSIGSGSGGLLDKSHPRHGEATNPYGGLLSIKDW